MNERPADLKAALQNGMCPFCPRGPFVAVAIHVALAHGVDHLSLRDMAVMKKKEKMTEPEWSALKSSSARERGNDFGRSAGVSTVGIPKRMSARRVQAMEKRRKPPRVLTCEICGKARNQTGRGKDPRTCGESCCWRELISRSRKDGFNEGRITVTAKIGDADVADIRREYAIGSVSQARLAERYGVEQSTISGIVLGESRKGCDGPIAKAMTRSQRGKRSKLHKRISSAGDGS